MQEDPIGVAGGINLYAFAGNNPAMFTDPFGLCPHSMRRQGKERECAEWNQAQVDKARKIIRKHAGTAGVRELSEDQPVAAVNDDQVTNACRSSDPTATRTNRGCITSSGLIIVNADRNPENIAATIQHELVHARGTISQRKDRLGPFGEECAAAVEMATTRIFGAQPDRLSPRFTVNPKARCE